MFSKIIKFSLVSFPKFLSFLRLTREFLSRFQLPIDTQWGFSLIGNNNMANGNFEKEETIIIRDLLVDVEIFVNIGANIGYYCCHALNLNKKVIAIEPNQLNLFFLLKNINNNKWGTQIEIFQIALGKENQILQMWGSGTGASLIKGWAKIPENHFNLVPVLTLDRILGNTIDDKKVLILVDIEGAEFDMLLGATNLLSKNKKIIWMIEVTSTENQPEEIKVNPNYKKTFQLFFNYGYNAYTADNHKHKITSTNIDKFIYDNSKTLEKTHNFIFIHEDV